MCIQMQHMTPTEEQLECRQSQGTAQAHYTLTRTSVQNGMLALKICEVVNFEGILGYTITLNQEHFDNAYATALLVALKILHHVNLIC